MCDYAEVITASALVMHSASAFECMDAVTARGTLCAVHCGRPGEPWAQGLTGGCHVEHSTSGETQPYLRYRTSKEVRREPEYDASNGPRR